MDEHERFGNPCTVVLAVKKLNFLVQAYLRQSLIYFRILLCFRDNLDKSRKRCSDLTSIGSVVRILSFRRVFLVGTDIFYLDIRKTNLKSEDLLKSK